MPLESVHLGVTIACPAGDVYAFVTDPTNLPRWAAGLGSSVAYVDAQWVADSPMGRVIVAFCPPNDHGVADHDVTLPDGEVVTNPMRVFANGDGADVVFTLRRRVGVTAAEFEADATLVTADLERLRDVLESGPV
jgi:hypothetical protein